MTPMRLADRYPNKPNLKGPTIDWYPHAEAARPSNETTLHDLIEGIRGDTFAKAVAEIRALVAAGDKKTADTLKKKLPAVSISGCVTGRRARAAQEGRFTHSGLLQIDLDAKDNIGWTVEEMREALQADPRMVAVFVSASGEGVKGIARIAPDVATHKAAFLAAEAHFKSLKLRIDGACKDPVRLCFVSHDPLAWLRFDTNERFEPVELAVVGEPDEDDTDDDEPPPRAPRHRISPTTGGLVLRESSGGLDMTPALVAAMLRVIPPRPQYDEWLKIASAVWDALGEAEGTAALCAWSPEEEEGEYAAKFQKRLLDVHEATLVMKAKEHGWAPVVRSSVATPNPSTPTTDAGKSKDPNEIPAHVFPVPGGDISYILAGEHIFSIIAPTHRLFVRGTAVHEVAHESDGFFSLKPVEPDRMPSLLETFGARIMRRELREDGTPRWRSTTMPVSASKVLLASDPARTSLPCIRQLISAPVLAKTKDGPRLLNKGWHQEFGGTYVTNQRNAPEMSLDEANEWMAMLLQDFNFTTESDTSRAFASFLSPAMKLGGWIDDDFPLDFAEADQSQAGKSYRHKLIAAVYNETPSQITNSTGGVGSLDERVAAALITGRPIITLENFRGRIDSQTLESALRGIGRVTARALRTSVDVDCSPFLWQLSTNGAELTKDLANRSIITRIRKREKDATYTKYPEGDLLAHVKANQPQFLGAVQAFIRAWAEMGCPVTNDGRHDFRGWCQAMDWIVQNLAALPPLLDGHREEQDRTANPKLQWLRDVVNAVIVDGYNGHGLTASDLGDVAEHHDLSLPGRRAGSTEPLEQAIGKTLGRLFRDAESDFIMVDGRRFTRQLIEEWDPIKRMQRDRKHYVIESI